MELIIIETIIIIIIKTIIESESKGLLKEKFLL